MRSPRPFRVYTLSRRALHRATHLENLAFGGRDLVTDSLKRNRLQNLAQPLKISCSYTFDILHLAR